MFLHQMSHTWKTLNSVRLYHTGSVDARTNNQGNHLGTDEDALGIVEDLTILTEDTGTTCQKDAMVRGMVAETTNVSQTDVLVQGISAEIMENLPVTQIAEILLNTKIFFSFCLQEKNVGTCTKWYHSDF